jgi:peptide/nickel transport system substrate-binding protein
MKFKHALLCAAAAAALVAGLPAHAKTFRWASAGEISTWDIHSQNNALQNGIHAAVYESLVYYNSRTFKIEPVLATSWNQVSPTQMRFNLRQNVKFHDGTPFTADDAVYSIQRGMMKTSNFTPYTAGIDRVVKVNANTIDIFTKAPNPVLLNQLTELRMMSEAWAKKNNSVEPKDIRNVTQETFANRNAMGTGPFILKQWVPDQRMVFEKNPNWWGKLEGNLTEIVYTPIKSEATRVAAMLSGEVDLVLDPSPQDLPRLRANNNLKVIDGVESRTIFFGLDTFRDELPGSNIKGKNPLKDQRVRRALNESIDIDALMRVTMRGLGQPTGTLVASQVNGWNEKLHARPKYDLEGAKKLLADAGYPQGFEVDFACPNNRYINDEEICQAVTAMWSRIGVKAKLRTLPLVTYFPMIQRYEASIYMLGWGVPTFDAMYSLQSLVRTVGTDGDGNYNVGRYSNPKIDAVIDRAKVQTDTLVRDRLLADALQMAKDDVSHIPLHNQVIPWAMKKNVEVVHRPDNRLDWRLIKVN